MKPLSPKDPKEIGGFTLVGRLGAGGMGVVYLASRKSDSVALKVIRESLIDDEVEATRFTREVVTLEKIQSPNVAEIIEAGVDDGRAWFAVEFINGPNLSELVDDKGPLPLEKWWELAAGVLQGLADVHRMGIIHRDVKPANVIMAATGPKLIDFGIAHVSDATSVTATGLVAGSPAWFSP
jgi:serine/threonine protein kinase